MLTASQKLNALAWAAKKANCSYGALQGTLSQEREADIFEDYEKLLREREAEEAERIRQGCQAKKKAAPAGTPKFVVPTVKQEKRKKGYQGRKYLNPNEVAELLPSSNAVFLQDLWGSNDM